MCDKEYQLHGKEKAMAVIESMDADEAKRYLCDLISDFPSVGMTIIINQKK